MNDFLNSNEWQWQLARRIAQGVLGVFVADIDLILGFGILDPTTRALVVAFVMAVLSPIMAAIGGDDIVKATGGKDKPWTDASGFGAWASPLLFQYTGTGRITGYAGDLDLDLFLEGAFPFSLRHSVLHTRVFEQTHVSSSLIRGCRFVTKNPTPREVLHPLTL